MVPNDSIVEVHQSATRINPASEHEWSDEHSTLLNESICGVKLLIYIASSACFDQLSSLEPSRAIRRSKYHTSSMESDSTRVWIVGQWKAIDRMLAHSIPTCMDWSIQSNSRPSCGFGVTRHISWSSGDRSLLYRADFRCNPPSIPNGMTITILLA